MSDLPQCLRGVVPDGAVCLASRAEARAAQELGRRGQWVVVVSPWAGGLVGRRGRARGLDLVNTREFILLPTWGRAVFAVEPTADTVRWVLETLVTVPPGLRRGWWLADVAVRGLTMPGAATLVQRLAPSRAVVGMLP